MLIRTIDELDKVHMPWAVVIDEHGQAWQEAGDIEGTLPGKAWICPGGILTSQQLFTQSKTLTLIYPRRYGDEDLERVADVIQEITGEPRIGRFERTMARAALNALEGRP